MIIPKGTSNNYNIGDKVVLIKDIEEDYAIFCKGHEFEIIEKNEYGYIIKDKDDITLTNIQKFKITLKIPFKQAKKEVYDKYEEQHFKRFCEENCPNTTENFDRYEKYLNCKLKQKWYKICEPQPKCAKYLKNIDKTSSSYLRKQKLKKLNG